jgi:hypothetical protein
MLRLRLKTPDMTAFCSTLPLQILDPRVKLRHFRLRRRLAFRANWNRLKGLVDPVLCAFAFFERHVADFFEDHVAFFQVYFLHLPARVQPRLGMSARRRIAPPRLSPVRAHRKIAADQPVYPSKRKLDNTCESAPKLQVTRKSTVFWPRPRRNHSPRTVQAQHRGWVSRGDIGHHAIPAEQPFASLTSPHVRNAKHSLADTTLIFNHRKHTEVLQKRLYKPYMELGILTFTR